MILAIGVSGGGAGIDAMLDSPIVLRTGNGRLARWLGELVSGVLGYTHLPFKI
jgi:hypothetical protein